MDMTPFLFGLYKLAKYGLYPLSWIILLLALLALMALLPHSPRRLCWIRRLSVGTLVLLAVLSAPITGSTLLGILESRYPPFDPGRGQHFDAIVVLGGGIRAKGTLRPVDELGDLTVRRTTCGAELYLQGLAPRLLLSGGNAMVFGNGPRESPEMRRWAQRLGVPDQAIVIEDQSRTTYENALYTKHLLGNASILLVTSPSHLPRAVALFKNQGFSPTPAPCGYINRNRLPDGWDALDPFAFLPTANSLDLTTDAITEVAGIVIYWATGKL